MKRRAMAMSCRMEPSAERSPPLRLQRLDAQGEGGDGDAGQEHRLDEEVALHSYAYYEQAGKEGTDDARAREGGGVQGDRVEQRLSRHDGGDEGLSDDVDDGALDAAYYGEDVEVPHLDVAERDVERKQHGHRRHG